MIGAAVATFDLNTDLNVRMLSAKMRTALYDDFANGRLLMTATLQSQRLALFETSEWWIASK